MKDLSIKKGFTLLELLLVIAIISLILVTSISITYSYYVRTQVDNSMSVLIETIRRAQTLSRSAVDDSAWGVKISEQSVILFKANDGDADGNPDSYSQVSRDESLDREYKLPGEVTISNSGQVEMIFEKLTGEPSIGSLLTIQVNSTSSYSRQITINQLGAIDY
jgi:prepilin-type N-terminal cleavage/methylation domain-containing protein